MAKTNFFLKEPKAETETLVYLFFSFNNQRLKYSTGEKIHPDYWNTESQRAKQTKKFPDYPEFNAWLDKCEFAVNDIYRKLRNDDQVATKKLIKQHLDKRLNDEKYNTRPSLFGFIDQYIEECRKIKTPNTIKAYNNLKNHLESYCGAKRVHLDFEDITLEFYNSFTGYLTEDLQLAQNTIGNKIKVLKVFMNEATDRGYNTNLEFRNRKFKKVTEETDKIYLNTDELKRIYEEDLSKNPKLERVRDLFIIGCFTGLRFSDFTQLSKENIIDGNKIKMRSQKTRDTVVIPLHRYVREILSKYEYEIPEPISNQKMNEYLKDVGRLAKIDSEVQVTITKGGVLQKSNEKKYKLISTHTARRSFASNLYLAGIPAITIMKITGHKTESSFLRYIRVSQEENANNLLNHPFFK